MRFSELANGQWFVRAGHLCQRLAPLNGSNTYNFSEAKWDYTEPASQVEPTMSPIHPRDFGKGRKAVEVIYLFGDGLWSKGS